MNVTSLEQVVVVAQMTPEGSLCLVQFPAKGNQLAGPDDELLQSVGVPGAPMATRQDPGESRRISYPAGDVDRLADELDSPVVFGGEGELDREYGQESCSQRTVVRVQPA